MHPFHQQRRISRCFYIAHSLTIVMGVGFFFCGIFNHLSEEGHLENFDLKTNKSNLDEICYATAVILVVCACLGFTAQIKGNKPCFWIMYCIIMGVMTLVEFAVGISALSKSTKYPEIAKRELLVKMNDYTGATGALWDAVQIDEKCCGVDNYTDWQSVQFGRTSLKVPTSCCLPHLRNDSYCGQNLLPEHENATSLIYVQGCLNILIVPVNYTLTAMGLVGTFVSLLQAILVGVASYLLITKKL